MLTLLRCRVQRHLIPIATLTQSIENDLKHIVPVLVSWHKAPICSSWSEGKTA